MKLARLASFVLIVLAAMAFAVDKVELTDLLKDPKGFDGKPLSTTGVVVDFKQKTSRIGNKYFTFKLAASDKEKSKAGLNVYGQGEAAEGIKDGVKVVAIGIFREEKKLRDFSVKNELDVTKVKDKEYGVKIVK